MKVSTLPVPFTEPDYSKGLAFDIEAEQKCEQENLQANIEWLKANGYTGKYTGEEYATGFADGYARYLFADAGKTSYLLHLPYGDAWHDPNVQYIPKKEVIRRIEANKKWFVPPMKLVKPAA